MGRPKKPKPSDVEVKMVLETYHRGPDWMQMTVRRSHRARYDISYVRAYAILKSHSLVTTSLARHR